MSSITTLGVVGAGPMGAGIAQVGLTAGLKVVLYDVSPEALRKSAGEIGGRIARLAEKGQIDKDAAEAARGRLQLAETLDAFGPCELVVEAIVERLDVKQKLFADLEAVVAPAAVLATNTSSLSVAAIASKCAHKDRVCGLHFFNPVPLMKLVEVIVAPATSDAAAALANAVSREIGKTPVTVKDAPGFLVNLQGRAYALEGLAIAQEQVAEPAVIDRILRDGAGFRMGPFELMDLTGIDVNYAASTYIYEGYQHDPRLKTTPLHQLMANAGRFGRKTGQGFFDYAEGVGAPPQSVEAMVGEKTDFDARLPDGESAFEGLQRDAGLKTHAGSGPNLIAPIGEDCSAACARLGLDPRTTVAVDFTAYDKRHLTLMTAPGGRDAVPAVAAWLRGHGFKVEVIADSPGFVLQRMLSMVANLGCELAQIGVGSPADIDTAMRLAQNYPRGPLEWADWMGPAKVHEIMRQLQAITGSDRYRPSLWLRRRAQLNLPIHQAD